MFFGFSSFCINSQLRNIQYRAESPKALKIIQSVLKGDHFVAFATIFASFATLFTNSVSRPKSTFFTSFPPLRESPCGHISEAVMKNNESLRVSLSSRKSSAASEAGSIQYYI